MRPKVLVSSRVDEFDEIKEYRDAVDQRLIRFIWDCGLAPVPVPNHQEAAAEIFKLVRPSGAVLSGGNDRPERSETESYLIQECLRQNLPVFGICHGFQALIREFGGMVSEVNGHVRIKHKILSDSGIVRDAVNSFHNYGIKELPTDWSALAKSEDGFIEWAKSGSNLVQGIMWHPEREMPFQNEDLRLVREHFQI